MSYKTYTSEFKAKVVIEVLQGDKSLSEIASEYNLNPNMVRNWKSEFLENASTVFENPKKAEKAARRKEETLKKEKETMAECEGVTEQLKAADQMEWVRRMNSIRNRAEEIVNSELIYC